MELRQLRYLVGLAEELHFGRAAARLHIAQPTLSQEIGKLERELGLRLFERGPRGVRPTDAGTAVLADARRVLDATTRLVNSAHALARARSGALRVGFVPATAPPFLPEVVRRFRAEHPDAVLDLVEYGVDEPSAGLRTGAVDVALVWPPVDVPGLHLRPLLSEPRVAVLPAGHPLAGESCLGIDQLADDPFVQVQTDDRVWADFWLACEQRSVPPVPGPTSRSIEGLVAIVAAGEGVGLSPVGMVGQVTRAGLAFVPVRDIPAATLAVAWRLAAPPPLAAAFVRACLAAAT